MTKQGKLHPVKWAADSATAPVPGSGNNPGDIGAELVARAMLCATLIAVLAVCCAIFFS